MNIATEPSTATEAPVLRLTIAPPLQRTLATSVRGASPVTRAVAAFLSFSATAALTLGCSSAAIPSGPGPTAGSTVLVGGDGASSVLAVSVSPLVLTPSFDPTIHDYYVRCSSGVNALMLTVTDSTGSVTTPLSLMEDQLASVRDTYWIRCLPSDAPVITVTKGDGGGVPTPGWYLVNSAAFAFVLDTNGTPVWYERGPTVLNVDSVTPNTISFVPNSTGAFGTSTATRFEIHSISTLALNTVQAVGSPTDAHELRLLPNGDHLLLTYPLQSGVDLTGLQTFGSNETIANCEIQEINPTGQVVWSWLATDHVDPKQESLEPATNTVNGMTVDDVFHCNSIEVDASGNLLVSMRHANAVFYIDRTTGTVEWKLGGASFNKDGATAIQVVNDPEGTFSMQHDARFLSNGDLTLFDDHGASPGLARGVEYALDHTANTASFVFQFLGKTQSEAEGSFRRYADGHSVIGWGFVAADDTVLTEIDANGADVFDVAFSPSGNQSYRAVKIPMSQLDVTMLRATTAQ
jgi:arylsulfotransferase ASST